MKSPYVHKDKCSNCYRWSWLRGGGEQGDKCVDCDLAAAKSKVSRLEAYRQELKNRKA